MPNTQWVISQYAPDGEGKKFEVIEEMHNCYKVADPASSWYHFLPKDEYIPTTPPERWERVPIDDLFDIVNSGETFCPKDGVGHVNCPDGYMFLIQDDKLVLQRRVSS